MKAPTRVAGAVLFCVIITLMADHLWQVSRRADKVLDASRQRPAAVGPPAPGATAQLVIPLTLGQSVPALASGWSGPEPGLGVWSEKALATVRLTGLPAGETQVTMMMRPFLPPARPEQHVIVRAGGRTLAQRRLTENKLQPLRVIVPADARAANGDVVLQLDLPDAGSPARWTPPSHDQRRLAVQLTRIDIRVRAAGAT